MAKVFPGRYTAQIEGGFVVFLIGMRINRLLALHKWMPVARAMGPMLKELDAHPELGLLGWRALIGWRGPTVVQYWRSFEELHAYAHARNANHLPAWAAFNRAVGNDGSVGIWHETFEVAAGRFETIYANMPLYGLAAAGSHMAVAGRTDTAKARLKRETSRDEQRPDSIT